MNFLKKNNEHTKLIKLLTMALVLTVFACSNDDDNSGGTVTFNVQNLVTNFNENPSVNDVIGNIQATSPGTLSYSLTSQTPMGALSISATTGELTVANAALFDFETNPIINATVSVVDPDNMEISNVTINLNDLDAIADLLTTSQAAYTAAANGDWVAVTEVEYNSLAGNLNEVTKAATSDADYANTNATNNSSAPYTIANNNGESMPNNSYVFAFKYNTTVNGISGTKVKQSSTSVSTGYMDLGTTLPSHDSGDNYFVLKGNNSSTTTTGFLAIYYALSIGHKIIPASNLYFSEPGNANNLTSSQSNATFLYQGLSTTQMQW